MLPVYNTDSWEVEKLKRLFRLCLFTFLVSILVSNSYALTLSDIRSEIRRHLKDNATSTQQQRWSSTVLNLRINNAQREIAALTHCISSTAYTTTVSGTQSYALPSNFVIEHRVSYSTGPTATAYEKIEKVLLGQLDLDDTDWESTANGEPTQYYLKDRLVYLLPTPNATWAGTNRLKIEYFRYPANLSSDTDVPFDSVTDMYPYHSLITYYVLAQTFSEKGDTNSMAYWDGQYKALMGILANNLMFKPDWQQVK